MPNASTVRRQVAGTQVLTLAPLLAAQSGTTATAFQLNANPLVLAGGGYNGASNANTGVVAGGVIPLSAGVTGLYQGTGQVLHIAATGTTVGLATSTLTLYLYEVPAAVIAAGAVGGVAAQTFTGWNLLATSSARAVGAATASFSFDARLQLDAAGNLEGEFTDEIASLVDSYAATTAVVLVGEADLNFVLVAKATTANLTVTTLSEFQAILGIIANKRIP